MKLLLWFLNFSYRHRRGARRYSSGGTALKMFYFIVITLAVIGSLLLFYFSLDLFLKQAQIGAIIMVILAGACILASIEFSAVYSVFAFRAARSKPTLVNNEQSMESIEDIIPQKKNKTLDVFLGIYFLCLVFVLIGGTVLIALVF